MQPQKFHGIQTRMNVTGLLEGEADAQIEWSELQPHCLELGPQRSGKLNVFIQNIVEPVHAYGLGLHRIGWGNLDPDLRMIDQCA
ncbi:hypothetical protein [Caballeronia catudaia]|uniref:hypothetical protein n=1 Tax=Caballeronia catudaia TaxID=1777136 RepID=UPI001181011F|nr:hypothetical protein [Caballeronia catudaia]